MDEMPRTAAAASEIVLRRNMAFPSQAETTAFSTRGYSVCASNPQTRKVPISFREIAIELKLGAVLCGGAGDCVEIASGNQCFRKHSSRLARVSKYERFLHPCNLI